MEYKIYILIDPATNEVRYVGQTKQSLPKRLKDHLFEPCNNKKNTWIKGLKSSELQPQIELIDTCYSQEECDSLEIFWIAYFKYIGCRLTNMTIGGRDYEKNLRSKESRRKATRARKGYKHSEETKKKISAVHANRSPEFRAKISAHTKARGPVWNWINAGLERRRNMTPEEKAAMGEKIRISNRTRILSEETHKRLSAARTGVVFTEERKRRISEGLKKYHSEKSKTISTGGH